MLFENENDYKPAILDDEMTLCGNVLIKCYFILENLLLLYVPFVNCTTKL